jgi:hypothetical protein
MPQDPLENEDEVIEISEESLDQDFKDFDITLESLQEICRIEDEMLSANGVCKQHAISIEEFSPGAFGDDYPIEGFTMAPSKTNYNVALEAVSINKDTLKVAAIAGVAGLLLRVVWWIFGKMKDTGAAAGGAGSGARSSAESAEKAKEAAKTISNVKDPLVPLDAATEKPKGSDSQRIKELSGLTTSSLSADDIAGLKGKDIAQIIEARRGEFVKKSFMNYNEAHEKILKNPSQIVNLMSKLGTAIMDRVDKDKINHSNYVQFLVKKTTAGESGNESIGRDGTNVIGQSLVKDIIKIFGVTQEGVTELDLINAAIQNMTSMANNIYGADKVDVDAVNEFVKKSSEDMFEVTMDTSDLENALKEISKQVEQARDERLSAVSHTGNKDQLDKFYRDMKESFQVTQKMSSIYFMLSKYIGQIYTAAISSNGNYINLVKNVLKIGVKFSKSTELENMKKHAEEMDVRVKGLKEAVDVIKKSREENTQELQKEKEKQSKSGGFLSFLKSNK